MLIDEIALLSGRVAAVRGEITCFSCARRLPFHHPCFADLDAWPQFRELLRAREVDRVTCGDCGSTHVFNTPLILELTDRNLLLYVAHAGDSGIVENDFQELLEYAEQLIGRESLRSARLRPYSFVHGWQGLEALLDVFEGNEAPVPEPPYRHRTESDYEISLTFGYIYGCLFFYYPAHIAIGDTVQALLSVTANLTEQADVEMMLETVSTFVAMVGSQHPWLVQTIGMLNLQAGNVAEAERWFGQAIERQHCWLAVTRSFQDATPQSRSGAKPQHGDLPRATASATLGDVTDNRHVVVRETQATADYGLWHFPAMEEAAVTPDYAYSRSLTAQGFVLGKLDRAYRDEDWRSGEGSAHLLALTIRDVDLLNAFAARQDLAKYCQFFWYGYIFGRWNLEIGNIQSGQDNGAEQASLAAITLVKINTLIQGIPVNTRPGNFVYFCLDNSATWIRSHYIL
jgi:hypothetical protein